LGWRAGNKSGRELVARKTTSPDATYAEKLKSPWLNDKFSSCILVPHGTDVPDGMAIRIRDFYPL
jgi:hypothetical protein